MGSYQGPVVVVRGNGTEVEAEGSFVHDLGRTHPSWRGSLTVAAPASLFDNLGEVVGVRIGHRVARAILGGGTFGSAVEQYDIRGTTDAAPF